MFLYCKGLTGSIPQLPRNMTDTGDDQDEEFHICELGKRCGYRGMFEACTGLSGKTPKKPSRLKKWMGTFNDTQITNDGSWPKEAWEDYLGY